MASHVVRNSWRTRKKRTPMMFWLTRSLFVFLFLPREGGLHLVIIDGVALAPRPPLWLGREGEGGGGARSII